MSFQKFETNIYCVGCRHKSGTKNIGEEVTYKKTGEDIKFLVGKCVICDKQKSMIVCDNGIQAEDLGDFFKDLGEKGLNLSKKQDYSLAQPIK